MAPKHTPCPIPDCAGGLAPHCGSPTCGWKKCGKCHAVLDVARRRGTTRKGERVEWPA